MVAQRSLLLAAASAFTASVVAHPHGAHHAHQHLKRQDKFELSYVTLYQTQPAGPNGTAIVYTITSPVWVPAGAAATATGTGALPEFNATFPVATPVPAPEASSTSIAVPAKSSAAAQPSISLEAEEAQVPEHTRHHEAPTSSAVVVAPTSSAVVVAPTSSAVVVAPTSSAVVAPPASSAAAPVASATPETPSSGGTASGAYKEYSGVPSEFPGQSEWLSFEAIFEASKGDASKGMASYGITEDQMSSLASGIKSAAASSGVDPRVVLAMAMQETRGVATTGGGGLIQATGSNGQLCDGSWSDIESQLTCGLSGVYAACVAKYPESDPWVALRCYNSGENAVNAANLNTLIGPGTASYCTDIANRLTTGWTN